MSVGAKLRFQILQRDDFACFYCGRSAPRVELHVDHVVPASKGGADTPENLVASCADCNLGKKDRYLTKEQRERILQRNASAVFPEKTAAVRPDLPSPNQCGPLSDLPVIFFPLGMMEEGFQQRLGVEAWHILSLFIIRANGRRDLTVRFRWLEDRIGGARKSRKERTRRAIRKLKKVGFEIRTRRRNSGDLVWIDLGGSILDYFTKEDLEADPFSRRNGPLSPISEQAVEA